MKWNPSELTTGRLDDEPMRFGLCYDGSTVSKAALELGLDYFMFKRKNATGEVLYVEDDSKSYLPPSMRKGAIEQLIDYHKTVSFTKGGESRLRLQVLRKDEGQTTGKALCSYSNKSAFDFLVVGVWGRKGTKPVDENLLASNANYLLQYGQMSSILIEKPFLPYSGVHFCVCMDTHVWSEKALVDAILLSETDDKISVVHIRMRDETDQQVEAFQEKLQGLLKSWTSSLARPRQVKVHILHETPNPPSHDLLDWIAGNNVHFVCVGTDAERLRKNQSYLGSTSATLAMTCVHNGVPVCISHFDERFATVGHNTTTAPEGAPEPLPDTAMTCTAGVQNSVIRKYATPLSVGVTR
jgi:hypothetical protein